MVYSKIAGVSTTVSFIQELLQRHFFCVVTGVRLAKIFSGIHRGAKTRTMSVYKKKTEYDYYSAECKALINTQNLSHISMKVLNVHIFNVFSQPLLTL